jgi:hypothetical protein
LAGVVFGIFALSAVLFYGAFHYLIATQKTGVYPPKQVLRKRAGVLAASALGALLLGIIMYSFQ